MRNFGLRISNCGLSLCVLGLLASLGSNPAAARQGSAGTAVGNTLLRGTVGARAAAMGGAYTAVAGGPLSLHYNAAGLADADRTRLFLQYDDSILDINRSDLAMTWPTFGGGFGLSASVVDYGQITRTTTTNKAGFGNVSAADYLVRLGYGRNVSERIQVGGTIGYYRLDLDNTTADGVTADVSALYRPAIEGMTLGVSIRNIGSRARFVREDEELPLMVVLAGSYRPIERLLLAVDYEMPRNQDGVIKAGAEFMLVDNFSVRAGYDGRNETDNGLTVGAGFRMKDLQIDYAYVPFGDLGQSHRVSAEVAFGAAAAPRTPTAYNPPRPASEPARGLKDPVPASTAPRIEPAPPAAASVQVAPVVPQSSLEGLSLSELKSRASSSMAGGRYAEAADWYRAAIMKDPGDMVLRYNLATAYYRAGLYEDAANQFRQVANAHADDEEAWLFLGYAESRSGRRAEAVAAWMKVLEINPDNAYAVKALGR